MHFATLLRARLMKEGRLRPGRTGSRQRNTRVLLGLEKLEVRTVPTFLAPVVFAAGAGPAASVVGDFNNDGRPDVIVTNSGSATVSTLLGNGDGTFQAPVSSPTGLSPQAIIAADFNGDGRLDVATSQGGSGLDVLYGNGDGTFQAPIVIPTGAYLNHLAEGDIDGNGTPDIVGSSTGYGGTIFVYKDLGGIYSAAGSYSGGLGAFDVDLADFNHDGKLDLVEANTLTNDVRTYQGNGDGTFGVGRSFSTGTGVTRLALGDFNRDGNPDIVAAGSTMSVLLGNPDGTFQAPSLYPGLTGQTDMQAADFNGDGNLDLIESNGRAELGRGDGSFYAANANAGVAGNTASVGDFNGDGAPDVAFTSSSTGSVTVLTNAANDASMLGGAVGLVISSPDVATAGAPFTVTVTAVDAAGNVVPNFVGTVGLANARIGFVAQATSYTFTAADAGTHTLVNVETLTKAGLQQFTVTSPLLPTASRTVTVSAANATRFTVEGPATTAAGAATSVTVKAYDAYGNVATGYAGTVRLASSDVQAGLPAIYGFGAADAGVHNFAVTLRTAGSQSVNATDTSNGTVLGTATGIAVTPSVAVSLRLVGGGGPIGSPSLVNATALDTYGNAATGYGGTLHLATTDPNATVSADVAVANGVATFTVNSLTLGAQTLTVNDVASPAMAATESVVNTPGLGVKFVVTPLAAAVAGVSQSFQVTVYDNYGNVATGYRGFVSVGSSDPQMVGVGYYNFTTTDAGVHAFAVSMRTAGTQSLTVSDHYTPAMRFSQTGIAIAPAAASSLSFTALHGTTAGVAQAMTVTLRDAYGNIATGYRGTINLVSSDAQAVLPAAYAFTAADAGVHTFTVTFKSAGSQLITVTDAANAPLTSTQKDLPVTAAAMSGFVLRAPSNVTAGMAFSLTVTAVDAYGNPITGYLGKVHFSGPSGIPIDYTFTAADVGTHVFSVTLTATGTQTIGVQDMVAGSLKGNVAVSVKTSSTSGGGTGGGGGGGGKAA